MGEENEQGSVEELDEGTDLEVVSFTDEDGKDYTAAILAVVEVEGEDYAILAPVDQLEDDSSDELELFLFAYGETEDGQEFFQYIEDEAIYNKVRDVASELLSSEEE